MKNVCSGFQCGGFQFLLILDLWGISFHAVVVVGLGKDLLFKSVLGHCDSAFSYSMDQKCFPFYFAKTSSNFVKMVLIDTASSELSSSELAIKNRVWILLFDSFSIIIFSCSSPDPTTNYEIVILLIQVWLVIYCLLFSSNNHIGL